MAITKLWDNNTEKSIEKKQVNPDNSIIRINKNEFNVLKIQETNNTIVLEINNQIYKAKILNLNQNKIEIYIFNFNKNFKFSFKNTTNINAAKLIKNQNNFKEEVLSPIAGKVVKINVTENSPINKNDVLVVIESMKMENEIRAQSNGFIKNIQISHEDLVEPNEVLMKISKKGEGRAKTKTKNEPKEI